MIKQDGTMLAETLRMLYGDEEPKENEVIWEIDKPIENDDQARIATAVMKRFRKQLKLRPTEEVEADYHKVAKRLEEWMEKKSRSSA